MDFDPAEQPVICQIFGRDVNMFREAAKEIQARGFSGIDINFGCPAKKVVGSGSGVALLREPRFCRQLIEAILDVVTIPLSIKVRASIRKERREVQEGAERATALDLVREIKDLPIAAIMIHGRSYEGGFSGTIDVEMIRSVKAEFKGVVLANGGIQSPEDAVTMLKETGADGIGIARGAHGRPWIFRQTRELLNSGTYTTPTWDEIRAVALLLAHRIMARKGEHGVLELRKHLAWYVRGIPGAAALRHDLVRVNSWKKSRHCSIVRSRHKQNTPLCSEGVFESYLLTCWQVISISKFAVIDVPVIGPRIWTSSPTDTSANVIAAPSLPT